MDNKLTWDNHISQQCTKAICMLRNLYKIREFLTQSVKHTHKHTQTLILSLFDYCDIVYAPILSFQKKRSIQKIQNSCIRFSLGVRRTQHLLPTLNENNYLTMCRRRYFQFCCLLFKILNSKSPQYLYNNLNV